MWGYIEKVALRKPEREPSPGNQLTWTLILDSQLPELWEYKLCCLKRPPVFGFWLWQPGWTKTLGSTLIMNNGSTGSDRHSFVSLILGTVWFLVKVVVKTTSDPVWVTIPVNRPSVFLQLPCYFKQAILLCFLCPEVEWTVCVLRRLSWQPNSFKVKFY